jgi:hypothetical protein
MSRNKSFLQVQISHVLHIISICDEKESVNMSEMEEKQL